MTGDNTPVWWSWADIIEKAGQLGIPHFQRGAVWDAGNRTALIESIYEKSPCGSFVLWEPQDDGDLFRHGIALRGEFDPAVAPMWLVDGQQRTRTMLDVFRQLLAVPMVDGWSLVRKTDLDCLSALPGAGACVPGAADGKNDDDQSFWAVALPAMRVFDRADGAHFGNYGESRKVLRGSMFRKISPQARIRLDTNGSRKNGPPGAGGIVPLATLLAPTSVFHDIDSRESAQTALGTFGSPHPDLARLDDLIPWGPQFVTGHTYEESGPDGTPPKPMLWADLHARRDANIIIKVEQLAGLFKPEWCNVFDQLADMLTGHRFAVGWLPSSDVSAAIDAYVRINRAGVRVRAEERALALLSRAHPELLDDLAEFARRRSDEPVTDRRALLTHESDRHLGFTVWMNTLTRYSTLALLGTSGRRWLGTSAIDKETFAYRLDRVAPQETKAGKRTWARNYATARDLIQECAAKATGALLLADSVLSKELFLDHRMARPATRALTPLIDLFYRLPASALETLEADPAFRAAMARLFRWTLLAPYMDQPDLEQLLIDGHGLNEDRVAEAPISVWGSNNEPWQEPLRQALSRYRTALADLWASKRRVGSGDRPGSNPSIKEPLSTEAKLNEWALDAFSVSVSKSQSLQHQAVGWLYAIERRGGATEFRWQAQYEGYRNDGRTGIPSPAESRCEAVLQRAVGADMEGMYPEKQHIVPFARARQIVNKGGTRATASPANAVGNLTWLTRRQNTLDALADRWTVMDREHDGHNLTARGMFAGEKADGPVAVDLYEEIKDAMLRADAPGNLQDPFKRFCAARTNWMIEQMGNWLQEPLSAEAREWLPE